MAHTPISAHVVAGEWTPAVQQLYAALERRLFLMRDVRVTGTRTPVDALVVSWRTKEIGRLRPGDGDSLVFATTVPKPFREAALALQLPSGLSRDLKASAPGKAAAITVDSPADAEALSEIVGAKVDYLTR